MLTESKFFRNWK